MKDINFSKLLGVTIKCGTCWKPIVDGQESILGAQKAALAQKAVVIMAYTKFPKDGCVFHHPGCVSEESQGFVRREDKLQTKVGYVRTRKAS